VALCASLSTSACELDRPFAGNEFSAWLSAGVDGEAATSSEIALDCISTVGRDVGEVMYEVDRRTSGVCVAMVCPSGRRNVTPGAIWVKTVGWTGLIMTAVSALAYGSLGDGRGNSKKPKTGLGVDSLADSNVDEVSLTVWRD